MTLHAMTAPSEHDVGAIEQADAIQDQDHPLACHHARSDVKENMSTTGYANVRFVQGQVDETLPTASSRQSRCCDSTPIGTPPLDTSWHTYGRCCPPAGSC
jgi:hypothetical protein